MNRSSLVPYVRVFESKQPDLLVAATARSLAWHVGPLVVAVLCLVMATRSLRAADDDLPPVPEVLGFVTADAGFVVGGEQFEREWKQFAGGSLLRRLRELPQVRAGLETPEVQALLNTVRALNEKAGQSVPGWLVRLCGESWVLAVYPADGPAGGMFAARVRDAADFRSALKFIEELDPGESVSRTHRGMAYTVRNYPKDPKRPPLVVALTAQWCFVTTQEARLRSLLDMVAEAAPSPRANRLDQTAAFRRAWKRSPGEALLWAYAPVEPWSSVWEAKGLTSAEARVLDGVRRDVESVFLAVRVRDGLVLELSAQRRDPTSTSEPATWTLALGGAAAGLDWVPDSALFAVAGRLPGERLRQLWQFVAAMRPREEAQRLGVALRGLLLGFDFSEDLLPLVEANWSLCVVPATKEAAMKAAAPLPSFPMNVIFEWRWKGTETGRRSGSVTAMEALDNALQTGGNAVAFYLNQQSAETPAWVRSQLETGRVTRWLQGIPGISPGYQLTAEHVVCALHAPAMKAHAEATKLQSLTASVDYRQWSSRYFRNPSWVAYVSADRLRDTVRDRRDELLPYLLLVRKMNREGAERRLDRIVADLSFFDVGFCAVELSPETLRVTVGTVIGSPTTASEKP